MCARKKRGEKLQCCCCCAAVAARLLLLQYCCAGGRFLAGHRVPQGKGGSAPAKAWLLRAGVKRAATPATMAVLHGSRSLVPCELEMCQ